MQKVEVNLKQRRILADMDNRRESLPILPAVIAKLAEIDPTEEGFAESVEELAECDPTFTVRLFHRAHSGMHHGKPEAATVGKAITRIGAVDLADLVLTHNVERAFVPVDDGQRFLWYHTLEVAMAARMIAASMHGRDLQPDLAYAFGMMHDIGRFVMFDKSPDELGAINEAGWRSFDELREAEVAVCGYDHTQLGSLTVEKWKLPSCFLIPIRDHHSREFDEGLGHTEQESMVVQVIQMADNISLAIQDPDFVALGAVKREEYISDRMQKFRWRQPPISYARLVDMVEAIEEESSRRSANIGINNNRGNIGRFRHL